MNTEDSSKSAAFAYQIIWRYIPENKKKKFQPYESLSSNLTL